MFAGLSSVRSVLVVLLVPALAFADDPNAVHVREPARWQHEGPQLRLDFAIPTNAEGLGAARETEVAIYDLAPHTQAVLVGEAWNNDPDAIDLRRGGPGFDVAARGWRTAIELGYDLGPFRLHITGSVNGLQNRWERGMYTDVGISISKTHRFSRWVLGWIALSVGRRNWLGDKPPPGEANSTTVTLSMGFTFR